jgi:MOSC domain-containing protein
MAAGFTAAMSTPFVARLDLFPIKSFDAVRVDAATVLPSGALAGDRRWAFVDGQDRLVNGKQFPAVHQVRTTIDPDASTGVFDGCHFFLAGDVTPLENWMSDRLGTAVRLDENPLAGFPDDTASPGPTLIATATLEAVAGWFDLSLEQARARFRTNIEIGGVPAFWEDAFYGGTCRIGEVPLVLVNPCARCVVPSRDARTGEPSIGFQKRFAEQRRATLAPGVDPTPFNHYYRLAVNSRLAPPSPGGTIRVGDPVAVGAVEESACLS